MEAFQALLNFISSLAWPAVAVLVLIQFRGPLSALLGRLRSAELPGGLNLNFDERLQEAKSIAEDITANPDRRTEEYEQVPQTEANKLLVDRHLRPSPSGLQFQKYKETARQDPVLALASLRTEIDAMIRNLADGFGVDVSGIASAEAMLAKLHKEGAVYSRQYELGRKVIQLCDAAIHGAEVTRSEAEAVIDIADVLASEYLDWLGWGFPLDAHSPN